MASVRATGTEFPVPLNPKVERLRQLVLADLHSHSTVILS